MKDVQLFGIARQKRYAELAREFRWDIPETFNFGTDVVDAWAAERDGLALVWENAAGESATFRFSDLARLSNRMASALSAMGVGKGDRVIVMLPRIPEWQVALIACLKIGAIAIPCIEMLTARDIAYRVENSGAVAAICRTGEAHKFNAVLPQLTARVAIGSAPGWIAWAEAMDRGRTDFAAVRVAIEDPAIMYYTSGSTGHPKGVLHAARALYAWRMAARDRQDPPPHAQGYGDRAGGQEILRLAQTIRNGHLAVTVSVSAE